MANKKIRWILWFLAIPIILLLISIIIAFYNEKIDEYFIVPLDAIVNIIIVIYFAYYLTKKDALKNKEIDFVKDFLNQILISLNDDRIVKIYDQDTLNYVRLFQRTLKNRIKMLKDHSNKLIKKEDIDYIEDIFMEYWNCVSDNLQDFKRLKEQETVLINDISRITNRIERILFELYI